MTGATSVSSLLQMVLPGGGSFALQAAAALATILFATLFIMVARAVAAGARAAPVAQTPLDPLHDTFVSRADEIAGRLAAAIKLKTISYDRPDRVGRKAVCASFHNHGKPAHSHGDAPKCADHAHADHAPSKASAEPPAGVQETAAALKRMHAFLQATYPAMHRTLRRTVVNELSLVYVWPGSDPSLQATALYAHMDVVPVDDAPLWTHPPFDGVIADGHVWGRGAIDDKQAVIGICEAIEYLCTQRFKPRRTLIVMLGHDEEIGGDEGAAEIAHWVAENVVVTAKGSGQRVKPIAFLLDEGLFVMDGVVPGMTQRTALICTAEKGYVNAILDVTVTGGHASTPPVDTAVGILAQAVARLQAHQFKARFSGPAAAMFERLLPYLSFPLRLVFANLWLTRPLVTALFASKPQTAVMVRTTIAPTVFKAGQKMNTLPPTAQAVINHRIHPEESVAAVLEHDRRVIGDPRVTITAHGAVEPSAVSDQGAPAFQILARSVENLFANTVAAPGLMVGATDSGWSAGIAENLYRHCPTELKNSDLAMFHGRNERIAVPNLARIACFYARVVMDADSDERF